MPTTAAHLHPAEPAQGHTVSPARHWLACRPACSGGSEFEREAQRRGNFPRLCAICATSNAIALVMAHPEADCAACGSSGDKMFDWRSHRLTKKAPILVLAALSFALGGCSTAMNCRLFGFQCDVPAAEQQAKAADDQARAKQEDAVLGPIGHYGTPYGPGPQYGEGGGDQYGYGPAYSYARQAPASPDASDPQH